MEGVKKTRECSFINVVDAYVRNNLIELSACPHDATNFIFWYVKEQPDKWGLTIKSIPKKEPGNKHEFTSQHTWKITWTYEGDMLKIANHCKTLATNIEGPQLTKIKEIYALYKKN